MSVVGGNLRDCFVKVVPVHAMECAVNATGNVQQSVYGNGIVSKFTNQVERRCRCDGLKFESSYVIPFCAVVNTHRAQYDCNFGI